MEGGDSEFAKFTLLILKAILKACCQNMSGKKQQLVAHAIGCPQLHFFPTNSQFSGQPKNYVKTLFSTLHHLSHVIFATATVVAFVQLGNSASPRVSADIIIRNKLRPTREHGSLLLYVHGNHKAR